MEPDTESKGKSESTIPTVVGLRDSSVRKTKCRGGRGYYENILLDQLINKEVVYK